MLVLLGPGYEAREERGFSTRAGDGANPIRFTGAVVSRNVGCY